jgi:hypothetical protein
VIDGMPQSPLFPLLAHKAPHFIHFRLVDPTDHNIHVTRGQSVQEGRVDGFECRPFFFNS